MTALTMRHVPDRSVDLFHSGVRLLSYHYRPDDPPRESPKPYFHPLRTLRGALVSDYRPADHTWHKGLQLAVAHVDDTNFWGGPTYRAGAGYVDLPNNGSQLHLGFDQVASTGTTFELRQRLSWRTATGAELLAERRHVQVTVSAPDQAWQLTFDTWLRNTTAASIRFGSPSTNGRPDAGYGGLFWRGPREFLGGRVLVPGARNPMGARASWAAYIGRQDETGTHSTVLFVDSPENPGHPTQWFARSSDYPGLCPAPFYSAEVRLPPGEQLALRYTVVFADGAWDESRITDFLGR
ncbi:MULTISPECIES: PmoA family protein [unclassified Crossiella]|uniref:DUF6807 domain-containing protein n=1 Tax=unclassified Crossiella TaxID=2620835 RepID=UPI001FFFB492|nr:MULTISPECIES: PmoA family protein [unclassified Crossiella]MCK2237077.1 PmoA family protein [Crossiella sp. S99.2]MCK2250745.1 PmoA family protein [Crossiella sp. S99.1]